VSDRVRFLGYRPEPALELRHYHALLLSSDFEGVPAVLLEALAAGIAIVATTCSASVASLLGRGRFGTLVPLRDCAALADAIARLAPGRKDRAAHFVAASRFTTEVAGPAYLRQAALLAGKPWHTPESRPATAPNAGAARVELPRGPIAAMADAAPIHAPVI